MNHREDRTWHLTLTDGHVVQVLAALADRFTERRDDARVVSASNEVRRQLLDQGIEDLIADDEWFDAYREGYR